MSGLFAPECNGAVEPHKSRMIRAFRVVSSSGAFPATVVTPSKLVNFAATIKANASSCPGSQSRMTFGRCDISQSLNQNQIHLPAKAQPTTVPVNLHAWVVTGHELVWCHFAQLRFFGGTLFGGGWATRAESTTRRWCNRRRRLALQ